MSKLKTSTRNPHSSRNTPGKQAGLTSHQQQEVANYPGSRNIVMEQSFTIFKSQLIQLLITLVLAVSTGAVSLGISVRQVANK